LEAVPERVVSLPLPKGGARVAFQGVSFHYSRGFGVEDLTFEVQPNEFWGIVGPSGGGKTTVIDLLLGFHAPDSGAIAIDGVDIRELSFEALREQVGLVSQDVFLWNASIWDNLVYPERHFTREAVEQAARMAEIGDFIGALPEGYRTIVGERGLALSAGERQRLALARAILRQPRLILLDEATSALDAITELRIRQALDVARAGRTAIVVAHRLATVMPADMILVIDKGRIAERGTPKELLARRGLFFELCEAQSAST
jgi:ABC-type multidrug transport system fused ATPase/permease subunit